MPDLVLYHSPQPLHARLAAAIHLGRLPRRRPPWPALHGAVAVLSAGAGGQPGGLLRPLAGAREEGRDGAGVRVCSLGTGAGPGVADRALGGLARLAGIGPDRYLLVGLGDLPWWVRAWAALAGPGGAGVAARLGLYAGWARCATAALRAERVAAAAGRGPWPSPTAAAVLEEHP